MIPEPPPPAGACNHQYELEVVAPYVNRWTCSRCRWAGQTFTLEPKVHSMGPSLVGRTWAAFARAGLTDTQVDTILAAQRRN